MVARSRARYLAPIALAATIIATYFVVHNSLGSKHSTTSAQQRVVQTTRSSHTRTAKPPTIYVVKPGDSLSAISVKTRIPVATLEALNPGVDPNALQTGQRLTLRK
jgi:LysM repeat protein